MAHRISRLGVVNAYLVEEDDDLTLIDTTYIGGAGGILSAAKEIGKPIRRIALTHCHADHTGSVDALVRQLPGVEVLVSARDKKLMGGDKTPEPGEPEGRLWAIGPVKSPLTPLGDHVGSLEVHASPGHTPGHVSFLDPRDGTLYCGDAYATLGGLRTGAKLRLPMMAPAIASWDRPTALDSARALRRLDPRALAPGHGGVARDPGAKMDAAIAEGL